MPGDVWQKFANLRVLYTYQYAHPGKKLLFMGGEFGQWNEWTERKPLDWVVAGMDRHAGLRNLIHDLNHLYRTLPALHAFDFESRGFEWISCDDTENSILVFQRRSLHEFVVCAFNVTPVPRENYRIGVPVGGVYAELFNSDAAWYGGTDLGNGGRVEAQAQPRDGLGFSLSLTLPPLAGLILQNLPE
jgi:1,4-alpha-glucan branching enzyme